MAVRCPSARSAVPPICLTQAAIAWSEKSSRLGRPGQCCLGRRSTIEADFERREGGAHGYHAIGCDAAVAHVHVGQLFQRLQRGKARIRHPGTVQIQNLQRLHAGDNTPLIHRWPARPSRFKRRMDFKPRRYAKSPVRDARSREVEFFERCQIFQILQAFVGDQGVAQDAAASGLSDPASPAIPHR